MTITQYFPQWLRGRLQKAEPQKVRTPSKKERQVLPTLQNVKQRVARFQEDESPPGVRLQWKF